MLLGRPANARSVLADRLRYVFSSRFAGVARLRALWHHVLRGYRYEICQRCGRPVGPRVKDEPLSWWYAPDELWVEVEGSEHGIRCITCFTRDCAERGIHISWRPVVEARHGVCV